MEQVIVDYSYGGCSVYRATLENAKSILDCHIDSLDPKALEIYESGKKFLNKENLAATINKILSGDEGAMATKTIPVTQANKQEIVMYCFNNKINIQKDKIDEYEFFKKFKLTDLSFFTNNPNYDSEAELVDEYVMEQARKYRVIQKDMWKEAVKEAAKVRYILEFAQELAHRDVKYEMSELKETV
jgi:hypothetical protein